MMPYVYRTVIIAHRYSVFMHKQEEESLSSDQAAGHTAVLVLIINDHTSIIGSAGRQSRHCSHHGALLFIPAAVGGMHRVRYAHGASMADSLITQACMGA